MKGGKRKIRKEEEKEKRKKIDDEQRRVEEIRVREEIRAEKE